MNEYRTVTVDKIIKHAVSEYGLDNWTFNFMDYTPWEARAAFDGLNINAIRYEYDDECGIAGLTNPNNNTILLFWKDIKSSGQRFWVIAHELGHAVHFTAKPDSVNWPADEQEAYADQIAEQLLFATGIWES